MKYPLSSELQQALAANPRTPIYLTDPLTSASYVLVPAQAFEKLRGLLADDSEFDPNEFLPLAQEAFQDVWDAPGMEAYDQLDLDKQNDCRARRHRVVRRSVHRAALLEAPPMLVVQNDPNNGRMANTILAGITTNTSRVHEPTQVLIDIASPDGASSGLLSTSAVTCENLLTVRQSHIKRKLDDSRML